MPDVSDALWGLGQTERLRVIKKTVEDFEVVESSDDRPQFWIDGILQPLDPQRLLVKPEGQREWQWWTLWTQDRLELDWAIVDPRGVTLRIMNRSNWDNYHEYQLVEGQAS